jgi:hypothetical protein
MKKILSSVFAVIFAALFFTACGKDQTAINRISGDWTIKSERFYIDNVEQEALPLNAVSAATVFSFDKCNLDKNDFCLLETRVWQNTNQASYTSFSYKLTDSATKMIWDMDGDSNTANDQIIHDFEFINKNEIQISLTTRAAIRDENMEVAQRDIRIVSILKRL